MLLCDVLLFKVQTINVDNVTIQLQIKDIAGQQRFRAIVSNFWAAHSIIIIIIIIIIIMRNNITSLELFESNKQWLHAIDRFAADTVSEM